MVELNPKWECLGFEDKIKYLKSHVTDCSFVVGKVPGHTQTYPAHKYILGSVSEVFERMFIGDFKESTDPYEIKLIDVEPCDFKPFLLFIYHNNDSISFYPLQTWIKLVYLGKKYMIKALHDKCHSFIKDLVRPSTPTDVVNYPSCSDLICIFDYAHFHEHEELLDSCRQLLLLHKEYKIFRSKNILELVCIYDLNSTVFYDLLTLLKNILSNLVMFTLIETYAKVNSLEMDSTYPMSTNVSTDINLSKMLQLMDYRMMSLKEFYNGPAQSTIIKMDIYEKYNIIIQICKRNMTI